VKHATLAARSHGGVAGPSDAFEEVEKVETLDEVVCSSGGCSVLASRSDATVPLDG